MTEDESCRNGSAARPRGDENVVATRGWILPDRYCAGDHLAGWSRSS